MPEDGSGTSARLHGSQTHHLRTLQALHDSLFAPQFRALETYGDVPPPPPRLAEVTAAAKSVLAWHRAKELEVAAELAARRAAGGNPVLIDDAARTLAHHRAEQERIAEELTALQTRGVP
jgi:hypothetical protein